jgi:hypothetical protein
MLFSEGASRLLATARVTRASVVWTQARAASSMWRKEVLVRSGADGRYRVRRTVAKPLAPVRLEGVLGVSKKAFRHGVLLPDGNVLPWYGAPGSEFLEFWRKKQVEWSALLAERRRRGLPEVFCCPR